MFTLSTFYSQVPTFLIKIIIIKIILMAHPVLQVYDEMHAIRVSFRAGFEKRCRYAPARRPTINISQTQEADLIRGKIKYFSNFVWKCDELSWHQRVSCQTDRLSRTTATIELHTSKVARIMKRFAVSQSEEGKTLIFIYLYISP